MSEPLAVPVLEDLVSLPVEVSRGDEPWVVSVTAKAVNGDEVTLTWDEVAASIHIRCVAQGVDRFIVERENIVRVDIRGSGDRIEFQAWLSSPDLEGSVLVVIGRGVTMGDALLRV